MASPQKPPRHAKETQRAARGPPGRPNASPGPPEIQDEPPKNSNFHWRVVHFKTLQAFKMITAKMEKCISSRPKCCWRVFVLPKWAKKVEFSLEGRSILKLPVIWPQRNNQKKSSFGRGQTLGNGPQEFAFRRDQMPSNFRSHPAPQ